MPKIVIIGGDGFSSIALQNAIRSSIANAQVVVHEARLEMPDVLKFTISEHFDCALEMKPIIRNRNDQSYLKKKKGRS